LSPLVQRARPRSARSRNGTDQHWSMLLFQSLSAGALALMACGAMVMVVVGVYVLVIWPLTLWDISSGGWERYSAWIVTTSWSVFIGGSLAGVWVFSGVAFRGKQPAGRDVPSASVNGADRSQ
jgi:hypothetical protein